MWLYAAPNVAAAFLASLVEFVEALTVILAVGTVRGWRDTLAGAAAAAVLLLVLVTALGSALVEIPLAALKIGIGVLLLLFGLRWLRKAILRAAGVLKLHDEQAAFARQTAAMRALGAPAGWDPVAFGAAFQITMLEGSEVVFIVIAASAGGAGLLPPVELGALAALAVVAALGFALRRPLASVPENALKFAVGVLLSAFGTFWAGEGLGIAWPAEDGSILLLVIGYLAAAWMAVALCRGQRRATIP
jgi:uncharacterized membrane protein